METFGLKLEKMVLRSTITNERLEINFSPRSRAPCEAAPDDGSEVDEATLMKEVLFLLEQFGVSDEFYHELTQILPALPRSYKVKGLRKGIDDSVDIIRLPKPCFGAYRPLNQLLECLISDQVSYIVCLFI